MVRFEEIGVLPEPGDNAAICSRRLDAGTQVELDGALVTLPHTVLEGHRFVVRRIPQGAAITSWSTPFARAARDLEPGDYVCTPTSLKAVTDRGVQGLPAEPSATNEPLDPYELDESALRLGQQVTSVEQPGTFLGYPREQGAAGTRNHVVILATSSRSSGFVTELARRFDGADAGDGVVPVAHTEGGEDDAPNNLHFLLATLAGFTLNPNVGAVLIVDTADDVVSGEAIRAFLRDHDYPEIKVPHAYFTREAGFEHDLTAAGALIEPWLPIVDAQQRAEVPLADLRIALQCGGSDAFSGISANPLSGLVGAEVIKHGGTAVLAETDELIGAEPYVLKNVRDLATARRFLATIRSFKERVGWHGHTAEGNPSGGNVYRGLYNIVLKSIGAARKLPREVRLDHVIDYGEPLPGPGYVFMDSPGNDLESVAGQIGSGCNLIFFTTGNGSITNFPFVPTLKFVTTSARYERLHAEMDVDAGRCLTGTPMAELTAETFELTVRVASGEPSAGERAGHSQVSIWRNWKQQGPRDGVSISTDGRMSRALTDLPADLRDAPLDGLPLTGLTSTSRTPARLLQVDDRLLPEAVGLILPTSLCSGQIALRLAAQAELENWAGDAVTRMVALPHTEGCGSSGGASEETFARIMLGYLLHPNTRMALLLEHGCEKTHNDYFRSRLVEAGKDPSRFGWASIQADGGLDAVGNKVREWFRGFDLQAPIEYDGNLGTLTLGLEARGRLTDQTAEALALVGQEIVGSGGSVVLSSRGALLAHEGFRTTAFGTPDDVGPTVAHGQQLTAPGWHVMRMPGTDWMETATGFGATGVQQILAHVAGGTVSAQRFVPVVEISNDPETVATYGDDLDAVATGDAADQARIALDTIALVASRRLVPKAVASRNIGFQITRGLLGTSM
ncbi:altronate hydrolase [Kribbella sandramycini]|uniref:Altronate dehydratase n=1 Tax=Kribbella sandramycini TaxID=60450 RepID=A0A7Y4L0M1_9ACTN|nr:UxaA family hydrolase [Kribbella sandramycini]MBB6565096.1 altronate dehydratase [Kribbella sandramycini]NOL41367.1 altronate hydrolase [Kribbella sandramycini]